MATPTKKPKPKVTHKPEIELDPDAWPKFEAVVKRLAKMGHKPHKPKPKAKRGATE